MSIGNASVTKGHDFTSGDTVTDVNLDALGTPTVALAFSGDTDTGLSNPSANILGVETGGTERLRVDSSKLQLSVPISGDSTASSLRIWGGTVSDGANLRLFGSTAADSLDNRAILYSDYSDFRSRDNNTRYFLAGQGGVIVGNTGSAIKAIWTTTSAVSIGPAFADSSTDDVITVTGAAAGDVIAVTMSGDLAGLVTLEAYVSASDEVTVTMTNPSAIAGSTSGTLNLVVTDIT